MSSRIYVAIGTRASGDQVDFVGTEADVSAWLADNEADPDTAYWRELTPGSWPTSTAGTTDMPSRWERESCGSRGHAAGGLVGERRRPQP